MIDTYNVLSAEDKDVDWVTNGSTIRVDKWVDNGGYWQDEDNVERVDILWEVVSSERQKHWKVMPTVMIRNEDESFATQGTRFDAPSPKTRLSVVEGDDLLLTLKYPSLVPAL